MLPSVCRLWHTACASEEGEVIVFGGCANNLLAHSKAVSVSQALLSFLHSPALPAGAAIP